MAYEAPVVIELGSVADFTRENFSGDSLDGGRFPFLEYKDDPTS